MSEPRYPTTAQAPGKEPDGELSMSSFVTELGRAFIKKTCS